VKLSRGMAEAAARLGHTFADPSLLIEALTHPSVGGARDNQRLEFLGDRVLGLIVAQALLDEDPSAAEGDLAPRLNALVRRETCAEVAAGIDLGAALRMGRSEMLSGGRRKRAILADAMEAVIAAIYLDAGIEAARGLVLRLWGPRIAAVRAQGRDAKTALQEWAQGRGLPLPGYALASRHGPSHAPVFEITVTVAGKSGTGTAGTKRAAEQEAAHALLEILKS
jgi:ribonuclease III